MPAFQYTICQQALAQQLTPPYQQLQLLPAASLTSCLLLPTDLVGTDLDV